MKIVRGFHSNVEKEWALRNRVQVGIFFHMVCEQTESLSVTCRFAGDGRRELRSRGCSQGVKFLQQKKLQNRSSRCWLGDVAITCRWD